MLRHLGEGTFSEVLKAESVKTRQKVAIKCMKSHFDRIEQVSFDFFDAGAPLRLSYSLATSNKVLTTVDLFPHI